MPNAKDVTLHSEWKKFHVMGDYGTGKSVFGSSFPTPGYVFDFDEGIETYRGLDFDYDQFEMSWKGWVDFERALKEVVKKVKEGKYVSVIVDSTTTMGELAMERALQLDPKRSATGGPIWNVHYQMVRNLMEGKLRQIVSLPCNILVNSHISIQRDDDGNVLRVEPLLVGQLSSIVPGWFSEVYYATTRRISVGGKMDTQFVLQTISIGPVKARSRYSGKLRLLDDFVPNDFNLLIKQMEEREKQQQKKKGEKNGKKKDK